MASESFSEKKMFYYLRFRDGYSQKKAAEVRFKKIYGHKPTGENEDKKIFKRLQDEAGYYARTLVKEGYLNEQKYYVKQGKVRKKTGGKPKIYVATHIQPIHLESPTPINMEPSRRVRELPDETKVNDNKKDGDNCSYDWREESGVEVLEKDIDVHHLSYEFPVLSEPKRQVHWEKVVNGMNGITQNYIHWIGEDDVETTIRYDEYPHATDKVVVWLPSITIPAGHHDNTEKLLDHYAWKASKWLQKVMQCRLGLPELYQKRPHYTCPLREPEIRKAVENGMTFKNGEVRMDNSDPKVGPCFESSSLETTKCYSELPDRTLRIEKYLEKFSKEFRGMKLAERIQAQEETTMKLLFSVDELVKSHNKIVEAYKKLTESQEKMIENQLKFQTGIQEILEIRNNKDKKKSKEADETMFG